MNFLVLFSLVLALFVLCGIGMGIRIILGGRFRAGCGGDPVVDAENRLQSCGVCPKKEINICDSDEESGLAAASRLETLGRFDDDAHSSTRN